MIVTLPYDPLWRPLVWAKEHCPSYITNDLHKNEYEQYDLEKIDYFFSEEKDVIWFKLKWL